jgi:hypothetical protein
MKIHQITLIILGFILIALIATNPSIVDHREAIKKAVFSSIENSNNKNNDNPNNYGKIIGEKIGESIGSSFIDKIVVRQNLLLFSFGNMEFEGKSQNQITLGIFGQIFLLKEYDLRTNSFIDPNDYKNFDSTKLSSDAEKKNNEIIGNSIRIGNLEVAQNDFPGRPSWDVAKKLCSDLGDGWRLPTRAELDILYQNKYKISGLEFRFAYWSSDEQYNNLAFYMSLADGRFGVLEKFNEGYARAVRSL